MQYQSDLSDLITAKRAGKWAEENPDGITESQAALLYSLLRVD